MYSVKHAATVLVAIQLAACASSSSEIRPQYVSHIQYQQLNCQQLGGEMERVSRRASEVAGVQDSNRTQDAWVTGAALVVFWPAAFFIKGDGATAAELGRLKGEFEALEKASAEKSCGHQIRKSQPQSQPQPSERPARRKDRDTSSS